MPQVWTGSLVLGQKRYISSIIITNVRTAKLTDLPGKWVGCSSQLAILTRAHMIHHNAYVQKNVERIAAVQMVIITILLQSRHGQN